MNDRIAGEVERTIVAARESILSSMRSGKPTTTQEAIIRWVDTVGDESTAKALAGQLIHLQAEQEKNDYPWSLHGYAIRCMIAMILLPAPAEDEHEAVRDAYRQAILGLDYQVRDWLRRIPEARAEIAERDAEEAAEAAATATA